MENEEKKKAYFKELCFEYLIQLSLVDLRAYGRFLNLPRPTYLKKEELINEILSVLCGEKNPIRTQRGAPIKNNWFSTEIPSVIEKLKRKAFGESKCKVSEMVETGTPCFNSRLASSIFKNV